MLIEINDECPCCNKYIVLKADIIPSSDPTKTICPECNENIYVDEQWICDPECESNGEHYYNLYNFEDYCYVFAGIVIDKNLLNDIYGGRILR